MYVSNSLANVARVFGLAGVFSSGATTSVRELTARKEALKGSIATLAFVNQFNHVLTMQADC